MTSSSEPGRPSTATALVTLLALSVAIYHRVPGFGLIEAWDDTLYFVSRPEVADWFSASWQDRLLTPGLGYPVPIPTFLHFLCRQLADAWMVPAAHLLNLVFHLGSVVVGFLLARRWLGVRAGFVATAIWASHPLLVECVSWITNLKGTLLALFVLAATLAWDRSQASETRRPRDEAAAFALMLLALGCRPEAVVLPAVFAAIAIWRNGVKQLLVLRRTWPIWTSGVVGLIYVPLALSGQHEVLATTAPDFTLPERLQRMGAALYGQLSNAAQAFPLHPGYYTDYPEFGRDAWLGLGLAVVLVILTVAAWRGRRTSFLGLAFFGCFYLPASGIDVLPRFMADTYMYLPLYGLVMAVVAEGRELVDVVRPGFRKVIYVVLAITIVLLALFSFGQTLRWQNGVTLWEPVIEAYPREAQPYWIVGQTYARLGMHEEALATFEKGKEAFVIRKRVPLKMAEELLAAGRPDEAARIAAEILTYGGLPDPSAGAFFAWVIANHDVKLPAGNAFDEAYRAAARQVIDQRPGWEPAVMQKFAHELRSRQLTHWADRVARAGGSSP